MRFENKRSSSFCSCPRRLLKKRESFEVAAPHPFLCRKHYGRQADPLPPPSQASARHARGEGELSAEPFKAFVLVVMLVLLSAFKARAYTNLAGAYAALGIDPNFPGNKVVVVCSDQHMNLDVAHSAAPVVTTNFEPQLIRVINSMSPPPAKILWAGDVSSSLSLVPGMDGRPYAFTTATNELNYFKLGLRAFTNVAQADNLVIPGNHDQTPNETDVDTLRYALPWVNPRQVLDIGRVRFFLFNSGNYASPSPSDIDWLRAQLAATSTTQEIVIATHQQPYPGAATQRQVGALLKQLLSSWPSRWWILCGHGHAYGMSTWDIGVSNVVQLSVGPSSTNTVTGYNQDVGCMFLCLSNGIAGMIYYRMKYESFEIGTPDWNHPTHYIAPFSETPGVLWQRFKTHTNFSEVVVANYFNDSWDWYAYPQDMQWAMSLAQHDRQATDFLLLAESFDPSVHTFFSADRTNWTETTIPPPTNHVYRFRIPDNIRNLETGYFRLTGSSGNNFISAWGLATTNPPPYKRYPRLTQITNINGIAGQPLRLKNLVVDPYFPPDSLKFTLLSAPAGAQIDPATGVFSWTPPASSNTAKFSVQIAVSDGAPSPFGDTQTLSIAVLNPARLSVGTPKGTNQFELSLYGDTGVTYCVESSTDLINWNALLTTNPAATAVLIRFGTTPTIPKMFYRAFTINTNATVGP